MAFMNASMTRRSFLGAAALMALAMPLAGCAQTNTQGSTSASSAASSSVSSAASSNSSSAADSALSSSSAASTTGNALVAYFSRAGENYSVGVVEVGNTQKVAEEIARQTGADTFKIETVQTYPEGYEDCKVVATEERDSDARPELAGEVDNWDSYDTIYLGYPIWYGDMPMALYTFLENHDFTGKTVIPFNTHGGSGQASTVSSIRSAAARATVEEGAALSGSDAQNDPAAVTAFVERLVG